MNPERLRESFLAALADTGSVSAACHRSKLPRRTAYNWRDADEAFAKAWDEAQELGTDALEDEAVRRATEGTLRPVFQGGKKVGAIREYSDTLLIFLLKGRRPEKFRDRVAGKGDAHSNSVQTIVQTIVGVTKEEILGTRPSLEEPERHARMPDRIQQRQLEPPISPNPHCAQ